PTAGRWTGISCGNSSGLRDKYRNTTKLPKVRGGVLAQLPLDAPPAAAYPAPWRRGAEGATVTKPSTAAAAIVGATVVTFLGGFVALFGVGQSAKSEKKEVTQLGPASSLRAMVYCAKVGRLALHWDNGDFELWDTREARRLGQVMRLDRPVG